MSPRVMPWLLIVVITGDPVATKVFYQRFCYDNFCIGYSGMEGETESRTVSLLGKRHEVIVQGIPDYAAHAGHRPDIWDDTISKADAIILLVEPAKPEALAALEKLRLELLGPAIDREKSRRALPESALVLLWDDGDDEYLPAKHGMSQDEQTEAGRTAARELVERIGAEDVSISFARARSGEGIFDAGIAAVAAVLKREQCSPDAVNPSRQEEEEEEEKKKRNVREAQQRKKIGWWRKLLRRILRRIGV